MEDCAVLVNDSRKVLNRFHRLVLKSQSKQDRFWRVNGRCQIPRNHVCF